MSCNYDGISYILSFNCTESIVIASISINQIIYHQEIKIYQAEDGEYQPLIGNDVINNTS